MRICRSKSACRIRRKVVREALLPLQGLLYCRHPAARILALPTRTTTQLSCPLAPLCTTDQPTHRTPVLRRAWCSDRAPSAIGDAPLLIGPVRPWTRRPAPARPPVPGRVASPPPVHAAGPLQGARGPELGGADGALPGCERCNHPAPTLPLQCLLDIFATTCCMHAATFRASLVAKAPGAQNFLRLARLKVLFKFPKPWDSSMRSAW